MPDYFVDTSAFAKLYHLEDGSEFMERLVSHGGNGSFISRLTLIEIESVIAIKRRTGELDEAGQTLFRRRMQSDLSQLRIRITAPFDEQHHVRARQLMLQFGATMALRTLDALQLAVALRMHEDGMVSAVLSSDRRLCGVARLCGCAAIDPCDPVLWITGK